MEIPVLVRSLKSSILSSTNLQRDKTFWGVVSAAVEQSRRKANMIAQGDGKFGPWGWPQGPSKQKKKNEEAFLYPIFGPYDQLHCRYQALITWRQVLYNTSKRFYFFRKIHLFYIHIKHTLLLSVLLSLLFLVAFIWLLIFFCFVSMLKHVRIGDLGLQTYGILIGCLHYSFL